MKPRELALKAHGGLDRWNRFNEITTTIVGGGGLWPMKNAALDPSPREMTVALHEEKASITPFGQPDWRTAFTPDRVAIETTAGTVVQERSNPRASFAGHVMNTPLGSTSPCVFQWLCDVDLSHDAIFYGNAGIRGHGNFAMARKW